MPILILSAKVATVLTVYGIETLKILRSLPREDTSGVATVLTVYGIETVESFDKSTGMMSCNSTYRLRY